MTGPDHYAEAEEIIGQVTSGNYDTSKYSDTEMLAMAQVHAALAQAAATAPGTSDVEARMWTEVAGTKLSGG
jgi:hypothetical protein